MNDAPDDGCAAIYFDGISARARPVRLHAVGADLDVQGDGVARTIAHAEVQWPEVTRYGALILRFADGASAEVEDRAAFARLAAAAGVRSGLVARAQNRWSLALGALVALVLVTVLLVTYGVPLISHWLARHTPETFERSLRDAALAIIDDRYMESTALSVDRQEHVRAKLLALLAQAGEPGVQPEILFRGSRIGPNALALPGGTIILTDALIEIAPSDDALFGVFAHEYGHLNLNHGLRGLYESISVAVLAGALFGDYSSFAAAAPALLTTLSYSRAREHEADLEALRLMHAAGRPPEEMARMFEALVAEHGKRGRSAPPIAFSSHPPDAERIELFRVAGQGR